jgi:toxin ParE1/3/4
VGSIRLALPAQRDLQDIHDHIAAERPASAREVADAILRRIAILADHREAGHWRRGLGRGARVMVESPYVIIYEVEADGVRVLRILHGARRITRRSLAPG